MQDLPAEELGGDLVRKQKRKKRNLRFLTATLLSAAVMIAGLVGVILFAVCVIFCTYVNRSDVSLNNKEILV